ncbi:50S ribosomal protein L35ae [Candidatus Woesearchaeota archaeon]|nr:50S ribosomal protein L35ae [Candidatus Woesearchaeota archaeon]|tara:strand:- start:9777 stop:10034 length:258 start_codon:yes stop_codon:yes gene_type:complete
MQAVIVNFRRGRHTQTCNQMVIKPAEVNDKDKAKELIGKTVTWKSPAGKQIKGKITKEHGNSGAVRALFERGMPGQSIGNSVKIE